MYVPIYIFLSCRMRINRARVKKKSLLSLYLYLSTYIQNFEYFSHSLLYIVYVICVYDFFSFLVRSFIETVFLFVLCLVKLFWDFREIAVICHIKILYIFLFFFFLLQESTSAGMIWQIFFFEHTGPISWSCTISGFEGVWGKSVEIKREKGRQIVCWFFANLIILRETRRME